MTRYETWGAAPWIVAPVRNAISQAIEYEELLIQIAAVTGEPYDDVRRRIKTTADGSLSSLVDTAATAYVDAMMGRTGT